VATGFPSGQFPLSTRLQEIKMAVEAGAREIDIVINRTLALEHKWEEMFK
jgi:deoxyribose-phosphate aldolase